MPGKSQLKESDGSALQARWDEEQLRALWDFAQHDFDRFLGLLFFMDRLR